MKRTRKKKAIAILMVVLVLSALVAIAVPFALSMGLHERKARSFRDTTRARLAAEGAIAHAISVLRRTEDHAESTGRYGPPWNTPDYDTEEEFRVDFEFADRDSRKGGARLRKAGIKFDNPRGAIWSVRVEDEQGKINILSAPREVVGAIIASGTLARDLAPGDRGMWLEDASEFFTDGDGKTVDGLILAGQEGDERMSYRLVDLDSVRGLRRDVDDKLDDIPTCREGSVVYAGEGADVADAARAGSLRTLHDMKRHLGPERLASALPFYTANSYRESSTGWLRREEVLSNFAPGADDETTTLTVRDATGLGPGTRVRLVVDTTPRAKIYRVRRARRRGERWKVEIDPAADFEKTVDMTVFVEGEQRHPVNVNTAPLRVLRAIFTGVQHSRGRLVTCEEAAALAEYVHAYVRREIPGGKPVASEADVDAMFKSARETGAAGEAFGRWKVEGLVVNATVANSPDLRRSTVPFCFKSFGSFTIEAAALVNTPAGEESARYVMRELVSLPVGSGGRWTISSQKDFDEQMKRLTAQKIKTWPFVEPPTDEKDLERYTRGLNPATESDPEGFVRLATGNCADMARNEKGFVDHFEAGRRGLRGPRELTPDGARVEEGSLWTAGSSVFQLDRGTCRPVLLETWIKPESTPFTMFSTLAEPGGPRNGIELKYGRDKVTFKDKFVLRVSDACRGQKNDETEWRTTPWLGPARYEYDLAGDELRKKDWYHVAVQVSGTGPGDASLWIDGRPVVNTGGTDDAVYRPGTRLADPLRGETPGQRLPESEVNGCDVLVDSTEDFPKDGAILVDGEVIEYAGKGNIGFKRCRRARRYTHLAEHAVGTLVIPYGYTVPLASDLVPGNTTIASDLPGVKRLWTKVPERLISNPNPPPLKTYELIEKDANEIPVQAASVFQSSGYAVIKGFTNPAGDPDPRLSSEKEKKYYSEIIFFGKADPKKDVLQQCVRRCHEQMKCDAGRMINESREFLLDSRTTVTQISIAAEGFNRRDYKPHMEDKDQPNPPPVGSAQYSYACMKPRGANRVEWIRLEAVDDTRDPKAQYLLGAYEKGNNTVYRAKIRIDKQGNVVRTPMDSWRWQFGTNVIGRIPGGSKLLPVFRMQGPQCGHDDSFRSKDLDRVTVIDSSGPEKRLRAITHAHCFEKWHRNRLLNVFRVSLDDFVTRKFAKDAGRLLKFPSGEMPRRVPGRLTVGPLTGTLDEFRARNFKLRPLSVARGTPVWPTADEIVVTRDLAMNGANRAIVSEGKAESEPPPERGVVRIDDELIYYAKRQGAPGVPVAWGWKQHDSDKALNPLNDKEPDVKAWALTDCVRGILGSQRARHSAGARVTFLPGLSVTHVANSGQTDRIMVADASGFPEEGYAVVRPATQAGSWGFYSGEIIGWERKSSNWLEGIEYLRGRFGTKRVSFRDSDLVQLVPFRYWSRYVREHDGPELAYFQTSVTARGARWRSIEWTEGDFDGLAAGGQEVRVVCRFDGRPGWETRPTNRTGGLWEFRGAGLHRFGSLSGLRGGSPVVADSIDVRVYFSYRQNAWAEGSNDWKRTAALKNLTVSFGSPLVVRKVDLLDY